ncbi:MAG: tRNA (N6-threonylcarbamoyladenosine(37)-N6)-methyltransferase TrmO [Anaerolineae bacterium]|jgi:tRNA-Thr(GGU) m(6)t(6)A37 methyltransferase TsaA
MEALGERAIGVVSRGRPRPDPSTRRAGGGGEVDTAEITIDAAWEEALDGIEEFSHIWVLWWIDRFDDPPKARCVHPEGRAEMPLVGLFATRSPHRPFPIGLTAVRLLDRAGNRLVVQGLDAFVDTLVLDIKPYLRRGDMVPEAVVPVWLGRLWQIHDAERGG